ncbi:MULTISPECIES: bifunctional DNA primase/polymerase [unclassified Streptomyces]|uniref:bifunctional DNA primase/polymerase n=1 Tax=unclassified Streptomyces TaxID=2593676 RepID=UPI0033CD0B39
MTGVSGLLGTALNLAATGLPVLPLRAGKVPFGNCPACTRGACGGRPNMKHAGPCQCPAPCHGWAAATTDPATLTSHPWARAWRLAVAVAYHPAGGGFTVLDLDTAAAVAWARLHLPATCTVTTSRGEHWIYQETMRSANAVRPGIDIKSRMAYARWLGPGTGTMTTLPVAVRSLADREDTTTTGELVVSSPHVRARWDHRVATGCRHTEGFVRTGLESGLARVHAHPESGAGSQAFGVARFLADQHTQCPGPCGLATLGEEIVAAALAVGVPESYARRAVANGLRLPAAPAV